MTQVLEYNHATQKEIVRDLTEAELLIKADEEAEFQAKQEELKAKATAKAALLERLGITEEEAQLLLG
jgi:hypothetical protein